MWNGSMNGWTDGWMDRCKSRDKDRQIVGRTNGRMDGLAIYPCDSFHASALSQVHKKLHMQCNTNQPTTAFISTSDAAAEWCQQKVTEWIANLSEDTHKKYLESNVNQLQTYSGWVIFCTLSTHIQTNSMFCKKRLQADSFVFQSWNIWEIFLRYISHSLAFVD